MILRTWSLAPALLLLLPAALVAEPEPQVDFACRAGEDAAERLSPLDSASVALEGGRAKICYSRPSARGRTIFGGLVPLGEYWRTGANEPTTIHVDVPVEIAGVRLEPGSYSIYTLPGEREWAIHLNRAVDRWGIPISDEVRARDVGSGTVPVEALPEHLEMFTIRFEGGGSSAEIVMEWERTRVRVPLRVVGD